MSETAFMNDEQVTSEKQGMFRQMRRIKQQISEADCIRILREEKRGVLSMLGDDGYPYGIPLIIGTIRKMEKSTSMAQRQDIRSMPSPNAIRSATASGMPDTVKQGNGL